jgi:AraC-like DNA-binding protein
MKGKLIRYLKALFGQKQPKDVGRSHAFETADFIQHRLDLFMLEKKPFLQPRYTIKQLSSAIKIPTYQLSAIINQEKGMNFSDYLNKMRIRYCEEIIKIEGGKKMNLKNLANKCGFYNRNTFTNAFKKFTGRTPSEYIRQYSS